MMGRSGRMTGSKAVLAWFGLAALSGSLVVVGIWLNRQFEWGRGPVHDSSPEVVVWVSLAAVALVLALWAAAAFTARRQRESRRSRGEQS